MLSGSRTDAEQEFVVLYTILDENESWYIQENVMRYTWQPYTVDYKDADFRTSNRMHGQYWCSKSKVKNSKEMGTKLFYNLFFVLLVAC